MAVPRARASSGRSPKNAALGRGDGWLIEEDRLAVHFDAIPAPEVRAGLKARGFRWSPTRGAWVRMLNMYAWYAARYAMGISAGNGR